MKKRMIYKTVLLLVSYFALFISGSAQDFTIKGRLIDSASAKPVASATINFQEPEKKISRTVVSDQNGAFQTSLLPGRYKV
ncbi:MAG TPA: carboxypeptidase-like regulatory domain-containing protein, partial [Flavisolibacter sp.]